MDNYHKTIKQRAQEAITSCCFPSDGKDWFPHPSYDVDYSLPNFIGIGYRFFGSLPYVIHLADPTPLDKITFRHAESESEYLADNPDDRFRDYPLDIRYYTDGINNIISEPSTYVYNIFDKQIIFTENLILFHSKFLKKPIDFAISRFPVIDDDLLSSFIKLDTTQETSIEWLSVNTHGYIVTKEMSIRSVDITGCCPSDFPEDRISELLNSDNPELIIFRGAPGTGKSTMLRHFINKHKDLNFYWLDVTMFSKINDSEFQTFLIDHKNGIYILEDCESILKSRDTDYNSFLASLLNFTDGMLGDGLKNKFVCTFNTDLSNIDKALLRKGRLKLMYEFKALDVDDANKLLKQIGKDFVTKSPMYLCDIFNLEVDNGKKQLERKKIGF